MTVSFFANKIINDTIQSRLNDIINEYGRLKYAYAVMNKRNPLDLIILNNHPEWCDLYLKSSYQLIDPVIIKALDRVEDFTWDETIMISSQLTLPKIFNVARQHNIRAGHTFVLHDYQNNLVMLSIFPDVEINFQEVISHNRENLQWVLISTHQKLLQLYQDMEGATAPKLPIFSIREHEVLYWLSLGKTAQEIAAILAISPSTVKFHSKNITRKLGVVNAKHAIKLAVELQLIKPLAVLSEKPTAN